MTASVNGTKTLREQLEHAVGGAFVDGNDVEVLRNGREIFPAMLGAIESAERSISFATFVYWTGDIAEKFANELAAASKRGVEVRVLLDAYGAKPMNDEYEDTLTDAGVEVRWFRKMRTPKLWRLDKRTHRKILVVDDEVGFTGGVGIAEEWEGDAKTPGDWRDTHARLCGPAVPHLQAAFYENWNEAGEWVAPEARKTPGARPDGVPVMVLRSSSTIGWNDMATVFRTIVHGARSELRIVTAYFVPDERLMELLCDAVARGVDVRVLIPGEYTDSRLSQLAGSPAVETLLKAGVRIWKYQRTMLHAKVVTADGKLALVGSPNANHRSMGKDEECAIAVWSADIAATLNEDFDDDCDHADELDHAGWSGRPLTRKLRERAARIIVGEL